MSTLEYQKIINFCNTHEHIFLYGAGAIAKIQKNALSHLGIEIDGFITTTKEKDLYMGLPVFSADEFLNNSLINVGIIPAFMGATENFIQEKLGNSFDIINLSIEDIYNIEFDTILEPHLDTIKKNNNTKLNTSKNFNRILVIRMDAIGDLLCTTPMIRELKKNYPKSEITLLVRKHTESLLKLFPYVDRIITYDIPASYNHFFEELDNIENINKNIQEFCENNMNDYSFDTIFLPMACLNGKNAFQEILLAFHCKAKRIIGLLTTFSQCSSIIYNRMKKYYDKLYYLTTPMHQSEFMLEILKKEKLDVLDDSLTINISPITTNKRKKELLNLTDYGDVLFIAVGILASDPRRVWDISNYIELFKNCQYINNKKIYYIIFGGNDAISSAKKVSSFDNVIDLTGKYNICESIEYISACDMYIGSNTGIMHMAAGLKKPTVTLYAALEDGKPSDIDGPVSFGVRGIPHIDLIPPAGLDQCHVVCRKKYSHCINQITPQQVEEAISYLANNNCHGK